jgi:hypothetical protein
MIDIVKLQEIQEKLEEEAFQEQIDDIMEGIMDFVLDKDLKQSFQEEKTRKTTEKSKRVLSYWVKKGIIKPAKRAKEGAWFYFDRIESIWIDIVSQIREFGFDLDKILLVRKALFQDVLKDFRMIDFCLMCSVLREPYLMTINAKGETGFSTANMYRKEIAKRNLPPHLVFNFYALAKDAFPNNNFTLGLRDPQTAELSLEEMKILYYLRTGDFQEIKVRLNDGETYLLEATRKMDASDKIIDIIRKAQYQNIEVKVENGRTVYISATEKIKL